MRDYYLLFGDTAEYSSGSAENAQIGTNVAELFDQNICQRKVATAELNVCRLDGSYDWYDGSNKGLGIWSECAGADGYMSNPLAITIQFKDAVAFSGAWAIWGDTKPQMANITFYNSQGQSLGNVNLADDLFSRFYYEQYGKILSDVKSIKINNIKCKPYQRFKLIELFVGEDVVVINSDSIASCTVSASYSPICNELPIDTLEAQLVSDNVAFSAVVKKSQVTRLENNIVRPYVIEDTTVYALGKYNTGNLTTSAGSELTISAENDMGKLSESNCEPDTMFGLSSTWYKQNGTKYGVAYRRNNILWQVLEHIGAENCLSLTADKDFSINTVFRGRATSSNCRELMQTILCGRGATSYMMRDGRRLLESTTFAFSNAAQHMLDHTLDSFSYDLLPKIGKIKYSGKATGSMFAWVQYYTSGQDESPIEYQAIKSNNVQYDIEFDSDFLPCMITAAVDGSAVATHRFSCATGFRPTIKELVDSTNKFRITSEDIRPGRMIVTADQSGGILNTSGNLPAIIAVYGLKKFENEADSAHTFSLENGSYNQSEINIPDFIADLNAMTKSWKAYAEYTAEVQFSTEKNVWLGEEVTIPAVHNNRKPPDTFGVKNINVHVTGVTVDLCSGLTQVKGVSKP